jgi:hypothetical protein
MEAKILIIEQSKKIDPLCCKTLRWHNNHVDVAVDCNSSREWLSKSCVFKIHDDFFQASASNVAERGQAPFSAR